MTIKSLQEIIDAPMPKLRETPLKTTHKKTICKKCNGTGRIFEYAYYKNGKCFACNGKGKI